MQIKIFTMTHKKFQEPEDKIYVPLHVGRASAGDLGYQGDDTGDSISRWNNFYGELTGVYWVWKNEQELSKIERAVPTLTLTKEEIQSAGIRGDFKGLRYHSLQ